MNKDREMRDAKGNLLLLEKPGLGVLVRGGKVVNQENYAIFTERQKQNKLAPVSADPSLVEKTRQEEAQLLGKEKKYEELEKKVDGMTNTLSAILEKLNEKN